MKEKAQAGAPRRPTIVDIARRAGVSPATVSNALTGRRTVDPATAVKVAETAKSVGYTPNLRARRLRTGRADTIAILSSMPFAVAGGRARMGFLMEIAGAAAACALESGIALILVPPLAVGRAPLHDLHIDGALVVEPLADDPDLAILAARAIPVVAIGRPGAWQPPGVPYIDLRSFDATRLLLGHLRDQGARRIGLIVGAESRHAHEAAIRAYGIFAAEHEMAETVLRVPETGGEAAARIATADLLAQIPELDALLVGVDVFATGALAAVLAAGRLVPQNFLLATRYDGVHARDCMPPLTVLDLHLDAVATSAVRLLLEAIKGTAGHQCAPGPMPTLKPRGSTGLSQLRTA